MIGKSLRYYRLKKQLTVEKLSEMAGVSVEHITQCEENNRIPCMDDMQSMADVLGIQIPDYLSNEGESLRFQHGDLYGSEGLTTIQREYVREAVEEYLGRLMTAVSFFDCDVLPPSPSATILELTDDDERNAQALRLRLGFRSAGPVSGLVSAMEDRGFLICECDMNFPGFSGMSGTVNERPYVVLNQNLSPEHDRQALVSELIRRMFLWPTEMENTEAEARTSAICGAFLVPQRDAVEMPAADPRMFEEFAEKYGVSLELLAARLAICEILPEKAAMRLCRVADNQGRQGGRPGCKDPEHPGLLKRLVCRAVTDKIISVQRGAELLRRPYSDILAMCGGFRPVRTS